jgi:hypothetical protein
MTRLPDRTARPYRSKRLPRRRSSTHRSPAVPGCRAKPTTRKPDRWLLRVIPRRPPMPTEPGADPQRRWSQAGRPPARGTVTMLAPGPELVAVPISPSGLKSRIGAHPAHRPDSELLSRRAPVAPRSAEETPPSNSQDHSGGCDLDRLMAGFLDRSLRGSAADYRPEPTVGGMADSRGAVVRLLDSAL